MKKVYQLEDIYCNKFIIPGYKSVPFLQSISLNKAIDFIRRQLVMYSISRKAVQLEP